MGKENTNLVLNDITDEDLKKIGLKVLSKGKHKGRYNSEDVTSEEYGASYIQVGPIDGSFTSIANCHYEILFIHNDKISPGFHKDRIYLDIHFEKHETAHNYENWIQDCVSNHKNLKKITWWNGYSGIRLKDKYFTPKKSNVNNILNAIQELFNTTYEELIYQLTFSSDIDRLTIPFEFKSGTKTSYIRHTPEYFVSDVDILVNHRDLQDKLEQKLIEKYSSENVTHENPIDIVKHIDLVVKEEDEYILYEIKTSEDPINCIREGLGQILEYSFYLNAVGKKVKKLVIAGPNENQYSKKFIDYLNTLLKVKLEYIKI